MDTNNMYWANSMELARQFIAAEKGLDEIAIVQLKAQIDEQIGMLVTRKEVTYGMDH